MDGVTTWLDLLLRAERDGVLSSLLAEFDAAFLDAMLCDWAAWARPDQLPPPAAASGLPWTVWLVLGGRGAGKTRTGAEWVRGLALGRPPFSDHPVERIALVGETQNDARDVMIEGVSGLLAVHPRSERPIWWPTRRRLEWPNGAIAQVFSAEDPESLRGPQFAAAWLDEVGKWRYADETFDMLQFGLRLGTAPRQTVTTTPRPTALLKRLLADPLTAITRSKTRDNAYHLASSFLETIVKRYAGTRLGRQELDGELIEERSDGLFKRELIEHARVWVRPHHLHRIVVAVDPPATARKYSDSCGIVAAALGDNDEFYILDDVTIGSASPKTWAERALALYHQLDADALVIETNQGGDMVGVILKDLDADVPVTSVRATRGKMLRAEPIALLYEQGRVHHVGAFPALEDEMCDFGPTKSGYGLSSGRSPDRMDALVWALSALAMPSRTAPRVRSL